MKTASRVSAALFVSYLATWMLAYAVTLALPLAPTEAVITTSLVAILVYAGLILWAFVAELRTVWMTFAGLMLGSAAAAYLIKTLS